MALQINYAFDFFNNFFYDVGKGVHQFKKLKVALLKTVADETLAKVFADVSEIDAVTGYPTGGIDIKAAGFSSAQFDPSIWIALVPTTLMKQSGNNFVSWISAVLYDYDYATKPLIGQWLFGVNVRLEHLDSKTLVFRTNPAPQLKNTIARIR